MILRVVADRKVVRELHPERLAERIERLAHDEEGRWSPAPAQDLEQSRCVRPGPVVERERDLALSFAGRRYVGGLSENALDRPSRGRAWAPPGERLLYLGAHPSRGLEPGPRGRAGLHEAGQTEGSCTDGEERTGSASATLGPWAGRPAERGPRGRGGHRRAAG